ncbi:hypothetical protein ABH534_19665 [Escherichia coli]|uniref:hypothetical protein n=1 Tax=Escherichia coli TaxID=562 RepID=UPI003265CC3A
MKYKQLQWFLAGAIRQRLHSISNSRYLAMASATQCWLVADDEVLEKGVGCVSV